MKVKSSKTVDIYPEYEGDGYFVEGRSLKNINDALSELNKEEFYNQSGKFTVEE